MADPLFTNMSIEFHTVADNKDADTRLEIWINKVGDHEAAYRDISNMEFNDPSDLTFDVPKKTNDMRLSEVPGSWIQLRITPHGGAGHDTWTFSFKATLNFADGQKVEKSVGRTGLSQDTLQLNFPLP